MGTPTNPAARFVAGFAAAAAALSLSSLTSSTPIKNPPTLARDAHNPCSVHVIDFFRDKKPFPLKEAVNSTNPVPIVVLSHGSTMSATVRYIGINDLSLNGNIKITEHEKPLTSIEYNNLLEIILPQGPAIANLSWGIKFNKIDKNGNFNGEVGKSTYSMEEYALMLHAIHGDSYTKTIASKKDLEDNRTELLEYIFNPQQSDQPIVASQKKTDLLPTKIFIEKLILEKWTVLHGAGNDGPDRVSPLSLIPGIKTVAVPEASYSSEGLLNSTVEARTSIKVTSANPSTISLSNGLTLPVKQAVINPRTRELLIQPLSKPLDEKYIKSIIGTELLPGRTSNATAIVSGTTAAYCNTLTEPNPAERLAKTRAGLLGRDR